ncbi:unnamed protein product [Adineta steineri]|uniref:TIR domain-containing protein n=1 Tax=Adineta steineri TaxID=433720 RepID=A0A813UVT4_9BILA|nr:unnamed protein product [Adineta steineri]CAF4055868.1 unnamed protein product [Adineta steineri]
MSGEKHVMLSYQWDSQKLVTDVYKHLSEHKIPLWMDTQGGMKGHLSTSMAEGVENAVVLCCFLTPQYQDSVACKDELTYAKERRVPIIPIRLIKDWKPSGWLGFSVTGLKYIKFTDYSTNSDLRINELVAEIQMVAGKQFSSIQPLNWNEEEEKHHEETNDNVANNDEIESTKIRLDENSYYRLTTQWQGDNKSLDILNDGKNNNKVQLAQTGNYSGQHWKMKLIQDDYYRLTTQWQGDEKSLSIVNNEIILDKTSNDNAQYWKITLLKNNYYRFTCKQQGYEKSLDIINDGQNNNKVTLAKSGCYSGQYWNITQI